MVLRGSVWGHAGGGGGLRASSLLGAEGGTVPLHALAPRQLVENLARQRHHELPVLPHRHACIHLQPWAVLSAQTPGWWALEMLLCPPVSKMVRQAWTWKDHPNMLGVPLARLGPAGPWVRADFR